MTNENEEKTGEEKKEESGKKTGLKAQIARFGIVGVISFLIDFVVYLVLKTLMERSGISKFLPFYIYLALGVAFCVSLVANYLLSMRFVFKRRDDMSRRREFLIFVILSVIGLVINEICMYIGLDVIYSGWALLQRLMPRLFAENVFFKFAATGVVMVYNFISRKIFLEKKGGGR